MDIKQFNVILHKGGNGPFEIQIPFHTMTVYVVPRGFVTEARTMDGIYRPGVYVLHGNGKVYVGQTRNGLTRIEQHLNKKDFWTRAVLFLADKAQFDLDTISGLEKTGIERAFANSPYEVENKDRPNYEAKSAYTKLLINSCYDEIEEVLNFLGIETKKESGPEPDDQEEGDAVPEGDGWTNLYDCPSLKGRKLERYIFRGKEYSGKNFTEMYIDIFGRCWDIDNDCINRIGPKNLIADSAEALQRDWMKDCIAGKEFRPGIFVNTWYDTDTKIKYLRRLLELCKLPKDSLLIKLL